MGQVGAAAPPRKQKKENRESEQSETVKQCLRADRAKNAT